MNLKCIPILDKSVIAFSRDEENGTRSYKIYNHFHDHPIIFNNTAVRIIDKIDGKCCIDEILKYLYKTFTKIEKSRIEKDLYQILYNLWHITLIKWCDNVAPFDNLECECGDYKFRWVHEKEVLPLFHKTEKLRHNYLIPLFNKDTIIHPALIGEYCYSYIGSNFIIEKNDQIVYNIFFVASPNSNSVKVYFLNCEMKMDESLLDNFFSWCIEKLENYIPTKIYRIDLFLKDDQLHEKETMGFKESCFTLKDYLSYENSSSDCLVSSYLLSRKGGN